MFCAVGRGRYQFLRYQNVRLVRQSTGSHQFFVRYGRRLSREFCQIRQAYGLLFNLFDHQLAEAL